MSSVETPDEFEYFFVSYVGAMGFAGNTILKQHKLKGIDENPDGFNLASAARYLHDSIHPSCVIQNWQKISKKRRDEFNTYVVSIMDRYMVPPPEASPPPVAQKLPALHKREIPSYLSLVKPPKEQKDESSPNGS